VSATLADVIAWLEDGSRSQRERLALLRERAAVIRALYDDDHERALREIRRRLRSPKLADEVRALMRLLAADRPDNPRPEGAAPPPLDDAGLDPAAAELEAAIAADPDTPDPYAVYGDLLQERGHPLGALIAIGQERLRRPGSAAVHAAHRSHLAAHSERLLGPLADHQGMLLDVSWYMGFIRACRVIAYDRAYDRAHHWARERPIDLGHVTRWLLDRPGPARFLQKLVVGIGPRDDGAYGRVCAAIARRPRPTLRSLSLGDYPAEAFAAAPASAAVAWPMLPGLRELVVRHPELALAPLELPALERLYVRAYATDVPALLAGADVPALERLALRIDRSMDTDGYWTAIDGDAIAAALAKARLPRLRSLAITAPRSGDQLCEALADVPLLAQLEELDLSGSALGDPGAASVYAHRDMFRHLRLVAGWHQLSPEGRARLESGVAELAFGEAALPYAL